VSTAGASSRVVVFLAGGGTGGHVFPLLSVASELCKLRPGLEPVFIGTERGLETRLVPEAGHRLELLKTLPFLGGGASGAVRGLWSVARGLPRCRALIAEHAPKVVLSAGGYAAVPMALAARSCGVPLAVLEPNSHPGLANRLVGPVAARAYTSFEETAGYFRSARIVPSGVPLRPGFARAPYVGPGPERALSVLVIGGSQGAVSLNHAMLEALAELSFPLSLTHQVGRANLDEMRERYAALGASGVVVTDFIEDMPAALAAADLVVSRAGGGAIAEICSVGRPSVLVPLAGSAGHQLHNARAIERQGAALCIPAEKLSSARLASALTELAADAPRLRIMAEQARRWGRPGAAWEVARDLLDLARVLPAAPSALGETRSGVVSREERES
jgi:UDP-N-acetylglucosamine--N-acetylmuramyl-(pentapeptide) pyrophosphoryl-undecaprenol N-acetylglucosamine transferase